ncbi:alpha/beta fold hydrolase [Pseudidiomarina insulisalsae]|uniref:Homoserine acetyltransferase n=1 Tax=Pseudidiomarina insulisalsae TaxID=575789 RepID=A0A432YQF5_9GAMM|nr:alpha/beta fold hydrolase [Pseudidiomarina insulisalsae]RUO63613.1 homoserine acetyltransferase [Pseudidiomarina insulisalsae]
MSFAYKDHQIKLEQGSLALRRQGCADGPAVLLLGGISGGRRVYEGKGEGWWHGLVEHAGLLDYQLWTLDYFGGMGESSCAQVPSTVEEHADAIARAFERLGLTQFHAVIGGSFGGCVAMALATSAALAVQRLAVIAASHRPSAQAVMLRSLQRDFIRLADNAGEAQQGVALARALAMFSYRGAVGLDTRFPDGARAVDYMHERAQQLVARNPAQARQLFTHFGPALDRFRIAPQRLRQPTLVVGFDGDILIPSHLLTELCSLLPHCYGHETVATAHGHDGFILNTAAYGPQLKHFLEAA